MSCGHIYDVPNAAINCSEHEDLYKLIFTLAGKINDLQVTTNPLVELQSHEIDTLKDIARMFNYQQLTDLQTLSYEQHRITDLLTLPSVEAAIRNHKEAVNKAKKEVEEAEKHKQRAKELAPWEITK
jgi:hypothetical protein